MLKLPIAEIVKIADGITVKEIFFQNNAPFKASFFIIKPKAISPIDSHSVKEAWIIADGIGELNCDDEISTIQKGDVIYFDSFNTHSVKNIANIDLSIVSIWWGSK